MPIDQFKTQILLLHGDRIALDRLSAGFGDRYTVHCATSGTEALNTLVETPINVLISSQRLPGMSGLEALREAKKRSPDTIGILLAGNDKSDLEALVGDEEVFQIISGKVTSDNLKTLVDDATRQVRLMALAESANDTAANPDDLSGAHIVMETADNGTAIVTDNTERQAALAPQADSTAPVAGARPVDVMVLTKDQSFLDTIKESSRGTHTVHYAVTLAQADETLRTHNVGVVIIDAAMIGNNVEKLGRHLRKSAPRLVSIVAGRRDDGEMLMDLINRGKVYRFLLKPVSPGRARLAVEASVKHHLEAPEAAFKATGKHTVAKTAADDRTNNTAAASTADSSPSPALDAFEGDENSLKETVTNLFNSVGNLFSDSDDEEQRVPPAAEPQTTDAAPGRRSWAKPVAAVSVALAASSLWFFTQSSELPFPRSPSAESTASDTAASIETVANENTQSNDVVESIPAETAATGSTNNEQPMHPVNDAASAQLDAARLALSEGRIFEPAGDNAVALFSAALASEPDNEIIASELTASIDEALGMAETAMLESRLDTAESALRSVATAQPMHNRLAFLNAQLQQLREREQLDNARVAIREQRFDDAATILESARIAGSNSDEFSAVVEELATARSDSQTDGLLSLASARLDSGLLLAPANDNARYYYERVLASDADNTAAAQGLNAVASRLVLKARTEMDAGRLNDAENTLIAARTVDASNREIELALQALTAARNALAEQIRRDTEAAATSAAVVDRNANNATIEPAPATPELSNENAGAASTDTVQAATDDALQPPPVAQAESTADEAPASQSSTVERQEIVAVSTLNRIRYVAPKYPRGAQRRNQSGWVDVIFTVSTDGTVHDIEIRDSQPDDIFDNAARTAVEKWVFEPIVENGKTIEKRAGVRIMFALE